jgi:sterol 3beta-glucosyltransferase
MVDDSLEDSEESWTFIGDDGDPELVRRIHGWETMAQSGSLATKRTMSTDMSGIKISGNEIPAGNATT